MHNKKIVFIAQIAKDTYYGGVPRKILLLADYLIKNKELPDPVLITNSRNSLFVKDFLKITDEVYYTALNGFFGLMRLFFIINNINKKYNICVLQAHGFRESIYIRVLKMLIPSIKHIYRVHTFMHGSYVAEKRKKYFWFADRITSFLVSKCCPISNFASLEMISKSRYSESKIKVIYNGVEPVECVDFLEDISEYFFSISIIGSVLKVKRQDIMIKALAALKRKGIDVKLFLVGQERDGFGDIVRESAIEHDVMDQVIFTGYVDDPKEYFARSDIICLTSDSEGLPNSIIEGMSCGRIVIAPDVGAVPEIIEHGVNGYIFERRNYIQLAEIIYSIYTKPYNAHAAVRRNAVKTYKEKFSPEKYYMEFKKLYMEYLP